MNSALPKANKQHFWQHHVQQAQSHSSSLADYARLHTLKINSLYYWVGVFKRKVPPSDTKTSNPVRFSAVKVSLPEPAIACVVQLSTQLTLQCATLPSAQWLAELRDRLAVRA